jgi:hypothetical protein
MIGTGFLYSMTLYFNMPSNHTNDDDHDDGATSVVIKTLGNGKTGDYNFDRVGRRPMTTTIQETKLKNYVLRCTYLWS